MQKSDNTNSELNKTQYKCGTEKKVVSQWCQTFFWPRAAFHPIEHVVGRNDDPRGERGGANRNFQPLTVDPPPRISQFRRSV